MKKFKIYLFLMIFLIILLGLTYIYFKYNNYSNYSNVQNIDFEVKPIISDKIEPQAIFKQKGPENTGSISNKLGNLD